MHTDTDTSLLCVLRQRDCISHDAAMSEDMSCLHFVGFADAESFNRAVRIFGNPDFIHRNWDVRAAYGGERGPLDVFVFATGDETATPKPYAYDDSANR